MGDAFDHERLTRLRTVADERYDACAQEVVKAVRQHDGGLSPEYLGLTNVWLEFAYQVNNGESIYFVLYVEHIEELCRHTVDTLSQAEIELLAVFTDRYLDWWCDLDDDDDQLNTISERKEWVIDELRRRIFNIAENEKLESSE